mgnify:CR=1 FL=1
MVSRLSVMLSAVALSVAIAPSLTSAAVIGFLGNFDVINDLHDIFQKKITIDRDSESELKDLYGDVGYTIIDDVLSLPEKLPNIYRRLTS